MNWRRSFLKEKLLNKQGDNIQPWHTTLPVCCSVSSSNCCFLTAYRFLRRQLRWSGIPISWRIFHSLLWSTSLTEQLVKESACNAGDPGSIPGLGRSAGEGIGYPLQYSWTSLVAQLVKNPPAMRETWVQSLGWEELLEKGKATQNTILA